MPIYFNEAVSIRGNYSDYHSGVIGRTYAPTGGGHFEAPLEISAGIMRKIGPHDFVAHRLHDDFTVMEDSLYSSFYLAARSTHAKHYSYITLDLYTTKRQQNLLGCLRTDAVMTRVIDLDKITVIAGGGYNGKDERHYDNIILRARAGVVIVVRPVRRNHFAIGDQFFFVSKDGVQHAYFGLEDSSRFDELSSNLATDWVYI